MIWQQFCDRIVAICCDFAVSFLCLFCVFYSAVNWAYGTLSLGDFKGDANFPWRNYPCPKLSQGETPPPPSMY